MEEGREKTEQESFEGDASTAAQPQAETLPSTEFVKVEKNLASLGFFTPSSKRVRNAQEKSFTITTVADGQRLEMKGTIIPSAKYGLPITADQDKWIALCKILTDIMRKEGKVTNPVSFTSADILRLLHKHRHSGKNYREVEEWLDVLFSTTIFSEGVVYLAKEKRRVKDRFRVFERAVSFGKELSDGKIADKNYVWFSEWQLQNINSNHLLPIDLEAYRELKNHIAKALVPLLQIWLYATRAEGVFEKRYDELCEMLNIRQYRYHSVILQTLGPSLDELKQFGYLADWRVEKTSDGDNYKIVFYHGEKFHRDRRARLKRGHTASSAGEPVLEREPLSSKSHPNEPILARTRVVNEEFLAELVKRGVTESQARKILAVVAPNQPVIAQLEWGDQQVRQAAGKIVNPAGFYASLVSNNVAPPPNFETNAKRKARQAEEERRENERREQQDLEQEYHWYCLDAAERYAATIDPTDLVVLRQTTWDEIRRMHPSVSEALIDGFTDHEMKKVLMGRVELMSMEDFKACRARGTDPFIKAALDSSVTPEVSPEHVTAANIAAPLATDAALENGEETSARETATLAEAVSVDAEPVAPPSEPMIIFTSEPPFPPSGTDQTIEPPVV